MSADLWWAFWGSGVLPIGLALLVARCLPHWHRRRLKPVQEIGA